jgi:hypothetical protein
MDELWQTGGASTGGPRFGVVWRGYDRHQVDEYVRRLQDGPPVVERDDSELSPVGRRLAGFFAKETRLFDVVLRGYDREEVDCYLEQFDR